MSAFPISVSATGTGASQDAGAAQSHWSLKVHNGQAAPDAQLALEISVDNAAWTRVGTMTGPKSCSLIGAGHGARYARVNVITLGTGAPPISAVITSQQ
jgi:hypothetical protein